MDIYYCVVYGVTETDIATDLERASVALQRILGTIDKQLPEGIKRDALIDIIRDGISAWTVRLNEGSGVLPRLIRVPVATELHIRREPLGPPIEVELRYLVDKEVR